MGSQSVLPFERGSYWSDINADSGLLGSEFESANGKRYIIAEVASGSTLTGRRVVKWASKTARTVQYITAASDHPCGVTPDELASVTVPSGAAVAVQIAGEAECMLGSGAVAITAGHFVGPNADSDGGKVAGLGGTPSLADLLTTVGRAVDAPAGVTDTVFTVDLYQGRLSIAD